MEKGQLIYKSEKSKFEIYLIDDQITINGINGNKIYNTFSLEVVNREMRYYNSSLIFILYALIPIGIILKEIYDVKVLSEEMSLRQITFAIICALGTLINIIFINKGFRGIMKFAERQENFIYIYKKEFEIVSALINNVIKDDLQREALAKRTDIHY